MICPKCKQQTTVLDDALPFCSMCNESVLCTDWMVSEGLANCAAHAYSVFKLLELYKTKDQSIWMSRARLYREWRRAGENTKAAAQKAISGEHPPERLL